MECDPHQRLVVFGAILEIDMSKQTYWADDGNAAVEYEAESGAASAQMYVDGGEWGEITSTIWVHVSTWVEEMDDDGEVVRLEEERHTVKIDPEEPECRHDEGHDWRSPYSVLGGLRENPGVRGNGGGVVCTSVCRHCGAYQISDSWAQDPETGEQGLDSLEYRESDEASLAYVFRKLVEDAEAIELPDGLTLSVDHDQEIVKILEEEEERARLDADDLRGVIEAGAWDAWLPVTEDEDE